MKRIDASPLSVIAAFGVILTLLLLARAMPAPGAEVVLWLTGGVAAGLLIWLTRQRLRSDRVAAQAQARLGALQAALGGAHCGWFDGGSGAPDLLAPGFGRAFFGEDRPIAQPTDLFDALSLEDAVYIGAAFEEMRQDLGGFQIEVATVVGRRCLSVAGRRGRVEGAILDLLVVEDVTDRQAALHASAQARAAIDSRGRELQRVLDAVPVPVWLRADDLSIAWCNRAFARAVDRSPAVAIEDGRELASGTNGPAQARALAEKASRSGTAQTESRRVVIGSGRRVLEVTETPLRIGSESDIRVVGYALDRTREEEWRTDLERHISAHAAVLEQLGSAIAIFGSDRRMQFCNRAYLRLWGFEETWLATLPTFAEVLEELRTRRRLPEHADFPRYKKQQLAMFTTLIEPVEDLMHLPDGTTLRALVVPHPLGGLMFVLEDVTNTLALESSYNTLMAVQQETFDNLAEGIAVFGSDGRLRLSNPSYAEIWSLSREDLVGDPHISDIMEKIRNFFDYGENWTDFKAEAVASTLERASRSGRIARVDGSVIEFSNVPLPDGAVLTTYLDVSDSVRVEKALGAANAALADADQFKSGFLSEISHQLRTPLNSITGFTEMLANQSLGGLNPRQAASLEAILTSGRQLLGVIDRISELATIEAGGPPPLARPIALPKIALFDPSSAPAAAPSCDPAPQPRS